MADRYTFLPLIGIFIIIVWTLPDLLPPARWRPLALSVTCGFVLSLLALVTHKQVSSWQNSLTLFTHALRVDPEAALSHEHLGTALSAAGDQISAIQHFKEAVRLRPDFSHAHSDWGNSLNLLGHLDEAIEHYREAIRLSPDFALAYYHLANALVVQGEFREAET